MSKLSKVEFLRTIIAIFIGLAFIVLLIFLISDQPFEAVTHFIIGPIQTPRRIGNIVEEAIPLTFSGVATIFLFKTNLYNLSGEGSIFFSAVAATIMSIVLNIHPLLTLVISIIVGGIAGAIVTFIPGYLRVRFNSSELVTSLMINYVFLHLGLYLIQDQFRDPEINSMYSYRFGDGVNLGNIFSGTGIHYGLIIAIIVVVISYYILNRTSFGYKANLVGSNPKMAEYSGINSFKIIIITQILGGFIAGLGGAVEMFGMYERFQYTDLTGYGWDGILIATMAKHNPVLVPIAAVFLGFIRVGASVMSRQTDVPFETIEIVQAVILVFISANALLKRYRKSVLKKEADKLEKVSGVTLNE